MCVCVCVLNLDMKSQGFLLLMFMLPLRNGLLMYTCRMNGIEFS